MAQLGRIIGDYQLLNELGRGGMGTVYKVNDYELAYTSVFMQRFEREIETLQRLRHPNIVQMYDVGESEDSRYYCMEYVDGGSLEDLLDSEGKLPLTQAVDIAYQVAEALEYAHQQHVIHRDIKPANILLSGDGTVKVTDFGVAKVVEATQVTVTSGIVGTIEYLAPEVASGGNVSAATDIYSLGATLYEMVTGVRPFSGDTPSEILRKQLHSLPEQPKYLRPGIPDRLNDLIIEMLEKQPERRIPTAQALKRELERIKVQLGLAGRTPSIEVHPWARRWQDYIPLAIGLVLLVGVGLIVYRSFRSAGESQPEPEHRWSTQREVEARNELRRAKLNFRAGKYELALDRCRIVLTYYSDLPKYAGEAVSLEAEIEEILRKRQVAAEGAPAPAQNPGDRDTPAGQPREAAPPLH